MYDKLSIEFNWLGRTHTDALDNAFSAEIGVKLGEQWLTELEELESRTTMKGVRACANTLGYWFASNWWRLRWEPEPAQAPQNDTDWRIAHSMASAGGGLVWPNVIFASDGETVAVASFARSRAEAFEPLRYLNSLDGRVSAVEFENEVDSFIRAVVSRGQAMGIADTGLESLWNEILEERGDPETSRWRRLEALCGYDPDDAPEALIEKLIQDEPGFGKNALDEIAAYGRHTTVGLIESIESLATNGASSTAGVFRCNPHVLEKNPSYSPGMRPWERAAKLAKAARKEWNIGNEPVSNMKLAECLRTHEKAFKDHSVKATTPVSLAIRKKGDDKIDIHVESSWATTRRFTGSRLLGQWLEESGNSERLIPATEVKTATQQFQRGFAQEFLCPYDALLDRLQTEYPTQSSREDAAEYFGVSPMVVNSTLANKGGVEAKYFAWA